MGKIAEGRHVFSITDNATMAQANAEIAAGLEHELARSAEATGREIESYLLTYSEFWAIVREEATP